MQNNISDLTGTYKDNGKDIPVTLNDICFQPLYPDNKNCTIYSVLNYFQNKRDLLHREAKTVFKIVSSNSSTHIRYCTR